MFKLRNSYCFQRDAMDCGAACLVSIARYHGKRLVLEEVRERTFITSIGVSMRGISIAADYYGFTYKGYQLDTDELVRQFSSPCILHWNQNHFIVLYKISKGNKLKFHIFDPANGTRRLDKETFESAWLSNCEELGIGTALFIEPTENFYRIKNFKKSKTSNVKQLWNYSIPYKKIIMSVLLFVLLANCIQFIFPFLTKLIVDEGIGQKNMSIILLILIAQILLYISINIFDFIKSWLLLQVNSRINISMISDFLLKLTQLPIKFFDNKLLGDLIQRVNDHSKIEHFLTHTLINVVFSFTSLFIFGIVLLIYSPLIFLLFITASSLYILWIYIFQEQRKEMDYAKFIQQSANSSNLVEFIRGMKDIKLYQCHNEKRWAWEKIQVRLLSLNLNSLLIEQYQNSGSVFINQIKNVLITYLSAKMVIEGQISLGTMLSIQFIVGQLEGPINQTVELIHSWQDAKISFERLGEVHQKENELQEDGISISKNTKYNIHIKNLSFQYGAPYTPMALNNVTFEIPFGKTTAIVGASGSGKTTLMKLILGFHSPTKGEILIGNNKINEVNLSEWRSRCGVVMQDSFIFSDTIANNITFSESSYDKKRMIYAAKMANLHDFVETLPLKYDTKIGEDGHGLSQGQKQRILIARVIYKDPDYVFFDESTNALDACNENTIMNNLNLFGKNKTAIFIAHRFSTIKDADQIIVLENGRIVEIGTHQSLMEQSNTYHLLMENQLNFN